MSFYAKKFQLQQLQTCEVKEIIVRFPVTAMPAKISLLRGSWMFLSPWFHFNGSFPKSKILIGSIECLPERESRRQGRSGKCSSHERN